MSLEIALLMSTYQRPAHLRRALQSVALQQKVEGRMELVVTDDGSTDETSEIVANFARMAPFPVRFTTHPHSTFQLARCRNEGVRASTAPYLLFLDGDCILPRDHVQLHLRRRKPGVVMAGDCCRLERDASGRVTAEVIASGEFTRWAPPGELRRLRKLDRASRFYRLIRHPTKPKLIGNNVGIWRADYERINGYDENFQGWGCEDDDLRYRLRRAGVQVESILRWTHTYHLWHANDVTMPSDWKKGANVDYLLRKGRLTCCRNGLVPRSLADLSLHLIESGPAAVWRELRAALPGATEARRPEVEVLLLPGEGRFSGRAECNVAILLEPLAAQAAQVRRAHVVLKPASGTAEDCLRVLHEAFGQPSRLRECAA